MVNKIKKFILAILKSRLLAFSTVLILLSAILLQRLFVLQVVNGQSYLTNYTLKIEKEKEIPATRGCIYDRNGEVLAYNELAYSVVIEDNGTYDSSEERAKELNASIANAIKIIEERGDVPDNDFQIEYQNGSFEYNVSGTSRLRFLADIFGHASVNELTVNKELGFNEATATAEQIMNYLMYDKYKISKEWDTKLAYEVAIVRYGLSANYYRKYISTTIATAVSAETVAAINENLRDLQGVSIEESTLRKYVDSEYFCHITGYTGKISQTQYDELSETDDSYTLNDYVGKSGIEEVMESQLKGTKGTTRFYVDNMGKIVEVIDTTEAVPGNDVYLSIDKNLQKTVYDLLEQQIAGVVYSHIVNTKEYKPGENSSSDDVVIPIYDVYFALINNNVVDIDQFADEDAMETEALLYSKFKEHYSSVIAHLEDVLLNGSKSFGEMSTADKDYITYLMDMIKEEGILDTDAINTKDTVYKQWKEGKISLKEYLEYAISNQWIDIVTLADEENKNSYSDTGEIYGALVQKSIGMLEGELEFHKLIYKYMIKDDVISGRQVCLVLFEQDVLAQNEADFNGLKQGSIKAYDFLREKIRLLEITPAQLALDPCSGSSVVIDPNSGEVLACVSYPGYDNNKLANVVDAQYYNSLLNDLSTPLYDFATQQTTAPGSTFKPITATAGLTEGKITTSTRIYDKGIFEGVSNQPKCWIFRSNGGSHGDISVSEAIRDSCNYFFYEVGFRLSLKSGYYDEQTGISAIEKYASLYGLGDKTGVEIPESKPQIANEYPVMAAIGQSNHGYATIQLARYVTTIANRGTVYNLTLIDKVAKADGTLIEDHAPTVKNELEEVSDSTWNAIHAGMRMVCKNTYCFQDLSVEAAGKTGTAQQVTNRPSHALFICFAPYDKPQLAMATRIAYGYTSGNAAQVTADTMKYYFNRENVVEGEAATEGGQNIVD